MGNKGKKKKSAKKPAQTIKIASPEFAPQQNQLTDSHKRFIANEGIDIYTYARSQGYSVYGAKLLEALGAQEAGYNSNNALDKYEGLNNFFGIDAGSASFGSKEKGIEYLMNKDNGLLHRKYASADSLLKQDAPSLPALDKGLKGYNLDPNGKEYATWLENNDVKGVTKRTLAVINDELKEVQDKINFYEPPGPVPAQQNSPFNLFNSDNSWMEDMPELKELKAKKNKLEHIKQELETGKQDGSNWYTNPFPAAPTVPTAPGGGTDSTQVDWQNFLMPQAIPINENNGSQGHGPDPSGYDEGPTGFLIPQPTIQNTANSGSLVEIQNNTADAGTGAAVTDNGLSIPASSAVSGGNTHVSYNYSFDSVAKFHGAQMHSNTGNVQHKDMYANFIEALTQAVQDTKVAADVH